MTAVGIICITKSKLQQPDVLYYDMRQGWYNTVCNVPSYMISFEN